MAKPQTDRPLDARLADNYRLIMSFSQNAKWVHVYAVQPTHSVTMASPSPILTPVARQRADMLTVTVESEMPAPSIAMLSVPLVLPTALLSRV